MQHEGMRYNIVAVVVVVMVLVVVVVVSSIVAYSSVGRLPFYKTNECGFAGTAATHNTHFLHV